MKKQNINDSKVRFSAVIFVATAMMLVLSSTAILGQSAGQTPVLNIILTKQTPYPAEPGKNVNVEIEVQNTGLGDANNVIVEVIPSAPFSLLPGSDRTTTFARISASSSVKISYDLKVDDSTSSNQYQLEFRTYYANNPTNYLSQKVGINVQGQPDFVIDSSWTNPENIQPGGMVDVFIKIKNVGTGTANAVKATFNSSSGVLTPVLSKGSVYLDDIQPGGDATADIGLAVDSIAGQQTYPGMFTLTYDDETGSEIQKTFSLGIPVNGVIDIEVINIQANFDRNVIQIDIANKGTADANSVEGTLLVDNQSIGVDYTSQLKATKKTTLEFPLGVEGQAILALSYMGTNLQQFHVEKPIYLKYQNPNQSSPASTLILVIIVLAVVFFVWRRFFRKKKK
jgi:hypothetical protein